MVAVARGQENAELESGRRMTWQWGRVQDNLLVAGLAVLSRARADPCVQVWDINQHSPPPDEPPEPPPDPEHAMAEHPRACGVP